MGSEIIVVPIIFIGLPWIILHYVTKWKTAATLTNDDERILDDMNALGRRLEERLETVERLTAQDNPNWSPHHLSKDKDSKYLAHDERQLEGRN